MAEPRLLCHRVLTGTLVIGLFAIPLFIDLGLLLEQSGTIIDFAIAKAAANRCNQ